MVGNANDGVDAKRQRGGDQHGPGNVGSLTQSKATFGLEHANRQQGSGYANGKVDEEDPVPVNGLGQNAAGNQADGSAGGGHEAVHANSLATLQRFRKHGDNYAQD